MMQVMRSCLLASMIALAGCDERVVAPDLVEAELVADVLTVRGDKAVTLQLDMNATSFVVEQIDSIDGDERPDMLRWYSPAFYQVMGSISPAYLIFTADMRPDEIWSDKHNGYASARPTVDTLTDADLEFIGLTADLRRANVFREGLAVCLGDDGATIMGQLDAGACYVACSGESVVVSDLTDTESRVVMLWPRIDELAPNIRFTRSEGHTTVELMGDAGWYVADPTFGFAYVTDRSGSRLDIGGLTSALAEGRSEELTFAVAKDGALHAVDGPTFMTHHTVLASFYYTPDKTLEVRGAGIVAASL